MLSYNVASWLKVNYFCGTLQRRESCCTLIRFWGQGMVTYNYVCMRVFVQHVGARTASSPPHQSADPSVPFMLQLGLLHLNLHPMPKTAKSQRKKTVRLACLLPFMTTFITIWLFLFTFLLLIAKYKMVILVVAHKCHISTRQTLNRSPYDDTGMQINDHTCEPLLLHKT